MGMGGGAERPYYFCISRAPMELKTCSVLVSPNQNYLLDFVLFYLSQLRKGWPGLMHGRLDK